MNDRQHKWGYRFVYLKPNGECIFENVIPQEVIGTYLYGSFDAKPTREERGSTLAINEYGELVEL